MSRIVDVEPLDCLAWQDGEHGTTFDDGVLWVLEKISELPTVELQQWILCSERLPNEGQDILAYEVFGEDERIIPANYDNGCWFDCHMNCSVEHIIAWMPLPEPYKEETE